MICLHNDSPAPLVTRTVSLEECLRRIISRGDAGRGFVTICRLSDCRPCSALAFCCTFLTIIFPHESKLCWRNINTCEVWLFDIVAPLYLIACYMWWPLSTSSRCRPVSSNTLLLTSRHLFLHTSAHVIWERVISHRLSIFMNSCKAIIKVRGRIRCHRCSGAVFFIQ